VAVNADSIDTWFIDAVSQFTSEGEGLISVALDDQEHTVEWLRSGEVLAAVTAHAQPVQGCNSIALGKLSYLAVASPEFMRRYFPNGVTPAALAKAPCLRFNRKDQLQAQWVRRVCRRELDIPTHWFPATQAFTNASLAGIGWGMNPEVLVREHLSSGALVELVPGRALAVPLYWQHTRLQVPILARLTRAVVRAARDGMR
jgi:LysR family transcriptional regulator (chromosome initiation inhibitor)